MSSDLPKLYEKQISLTEWFEAIGHPDAAKLRLEDGEKRQRLDVLNQIIGLPFDKPVRFLAKDVAGRSPAFAQFVHERGEELCSIRVIPDDPTLPKLRTRGHTIADAALWFDKQNIDPAHYRVEFISHDTSKWAAIIVISRQGIFGELTKGGHNELTQGLYSEHEPLVFRYDFDSWQLSRDEPGAKEHLMDVIAHLKVTDPAKRQAITKQLDATFAHDYLEGYFETTASDEHGIWFNDYNRLLGGIYASAAPNASGTGILVSGRCGSPGKASGKVRIVQPEEVASAQLADGDVLVCAMTTPDYLPLIKQAAAIVTELGGVLSHAAIVARELKKPCITGAKNATAILKPDQQITVNADAGTVS